MWNARNARNVRALNRANEKLAKGEKLNKTERGALEKGNRTAPEFNPFVPR